MRITAISGPMMEKTVKPYDAAWKAPLSPSLVVESPTCIAVSTMATYTVDPASFSCQKS
jgi:hypothetical protein